MIQLIIAADEPALFFRSVEEAECYVEWIDVRDGVYSAAYGAGGEPYKIWEDGRRVYIAKDDGPPRAEALRSLLQSFLRSTGQATEENEGLPELLRRCESYLIQ